jgi:predicted amidohydrolase
MPVRALENGVYTATANRVGTENRPPRPALRFTGRSQIVSPLGEVLVEAPASWETAIDAEIDAAAARDKSLPSGNDRMAERRPERYLSLVHRRRE